MSLRHPSGGSYTLGIKINKYHNMILIDINVTVAATSEINIETEDNTSYGIFRKKHEKFIMTENIVYESTRINQRLRSPTHNNSSF